MAKISNQTAYPAQRPVELADYLIGTDAATLATKTFTVQDLANAIDDTVTLQEVLNTGNTAYYNGSSIPGQVGNIILGNTDGFGVKSTTIELDGQTGTVELLKGVNGSTGNITVGGSASIYDDLTLDIGDITKTGGIFNINSPAGAMNLQAGTTGNGAKLTLSSTGSGDILLAGTGSFSLAGSTGTISIGNVNQGEIEVRSSEDIDIRASENLQLYATGANPGNVDILAGNGEVTISSIIGGNSSTLELHGDGQGTGVGFELASVNYGGKISGFGEIQVNSNGSSITLTTNNDNTGSITLNAGDDAQLLAQQPAVMVKVSKGSVGTITEGTPVYIVSDANGHLTVEAADASNAAAMPAIGIATSDITQTGGVNPTGTMVMVGVYEFSAGSIIAGGSANDALYVASGGGLTTTRPTGAGRTVQVVGRVIDPVTPDKIYVNAVGYSPDELDIDWVQNAPYVGDANGNPVATTGVLEVDVPNDTTRLFRSYEIDALYTLGNNQIQLGFNALRNSVAGTRNMAIGEEAMNTSNNTLDNIAIGYQALRAITGNTNNQNVVVGNRSTDVMTAGGNNVVVGHAALGNQVAGSNRNTIIGSGAAGNINFPTGMNGSTLVGFEAGWNTSSQLTSVGDFAGRVAGEECTFVGTSAGQTMTGNENTGVGHRVFSGAAAAAGNTGVGAGAAVNLDTGENNVVIGKAVAADLETGAENVIIGSAANILDVADSSSVIIGANSIAPSEAVAIGQGANANNAGQVIIGNGATGAGKAQAMIAFGTTVGNAYGVIGPGGGGPASPEMQFPNNAAAAAGGIPVGGLYTVGPLGGPASDPAILAIRTA